MSNPTSNFNWQMPTATDLVTDLPADFEVFGQAVDTSLADLKGGTTGQVLSKTSGTDMDFTWVDTDDTNAIQNAIVDAKGDLIAASAADTPARLAVGANGETLVADSSTSTGLRYTAASSYLAANLAYGTGTDQALNGGAAANNIVTQQNVLTSTWTRFSVTAAVPTAATQLVSMFTFVPVGTAGAADYYEITGVQIDQGSVALPFRTYAATIQGELAACQRYYYRLTPGVTGATLSFGNNYNTIQRPTLRYQISSHFNESPHQVP
jgi:hypothetical protein